MTLQLTSTSTLKLNVLQLRLLAVKCYSKRCNMFQLRAPLSALVCVWTLTTVAWGFKQLGRASGGMASISSALMSSACNRQDA